MNPLSKLMNPLSKLMKRPSNHELNMMYDPNYARMYSSQQELMRMQAMEQQQQQQQSQWLHQNRDKILGQQPKPGLPSPNPSLAPQPGTGAYDDSLTPVQRFLMERNFEMSASGIKPVAEQGFGNDSNMQNSLNSQIQAIATKMMEKDKQPTAVQEYLYSVENDGYTGTFAKWKQDNKASTNINLSQGEKYIPTNELKDMMYPGGEPIPPGTTYAQAFKNGAVLKNQISADVAGRVAMIDAALDAFPTVRDNVLDDNGQLDQRVMKEMAALEYVPFGLAGIAVSSRAKQAYTALETGMQAITRLETGAAMPQEEVRNTKTRFMPGPFDGVETQNQKLKSYLYFLNNAKDLLDPMKRENLGLEPKQIWENAVQKSFQEGGAPYYKNAPPIGTVKGGYTYMGGDPSLDPRVDQRSGWKTSEDVQKIRKEYQ